MNRRRDGRWISIGKRLIAGMTNGKTLEGAGYEVV
jgi:hypothetical protein